jgi:hypothetical protein
MTVSNVFGTAKSKIMIGTTVEADTAATFSADTFVNIGLVEDIGEFGDEAEEITFASISDARMRRAKGVRDAGSFELTVARNPTDAGQAAMRAALADDRPFNFKVELTDKPASGTAPKNTVLYFRGIVMGAKNALGSVKDVTKQKFSIGIVSEIVEVAASAI